MIFKKILALLLNNNLFLLLNKNILIILFGFYACSPSVGRVAVAQNNPFVQDLKPLRTEFNKFIIQEIKNVAQDINVNQESLAIKKNNKDSIILVYWEDSTMLYNSIETQIEMAKNKKNWNGFAVEVYKGNSRQEANNVKSLIYKHDMKLRPKMEFAMPYYRVRVGKFDEKYLAYPLYLSLKKIKYLQSISETRIMPIKVMN